MNMNKEREQRTVVSPDGAVVSLSIRQGNEAPPPGIVRVALHAKRLEVPPLDRDEHLKECQLREAERLTKVATKPTPRFLPSDDDNDNGYGLQPLKGVKNND